MRGEAWPSQRSCRSREQCWSQGAPLGGGRATDNRDAGVWRVGCGRRFDLTRDSHCRQKLFLGSDADGRGQCPVLRSRAQLRAGPVGRRHAVGLPEALQGRVLILGQVQEDPLGVADPSALSAAADVAVAPVRHDGPSLQVLPQSRPCGEGGPEDRSPRPSGRAAIVNVSARRGKGLGGFASYP